MSTTTAPGFKLTSTAFNDGQSIPLPYAGRGENRSPQLTWQNVPSGTQELALIVEDPDAPGGDFVHWIVCGIPAGTLSLAEGLPAAAPEPLVQGRNDLGRTGYFGPAPPPGKPHHYHFRLFALNQKLHLPANADKGRFRQALSGHVIAEAELVGTFQSR